MIVVNRLSKYFGSTAVVRDISFEVKEGGNLVLLGTSGSGKTTTLRMINRLIEPSSGEIYVNGKSIFQQSPEALRRSIGYVLQNNGLFPHYSVAENIAMVPKLLKWNKQKIKDRVAELLEKLGLEPGDYWNRYPHQLSGGQQQRVGFARALAADPPILLMDEPFGALDPIIRTGIRKEMLDLDELKRKTIILVTHDVEEAFELGDRICLMDQGIVMQNGSPAELLFSPANTFVRNFLGHQRLLLEMKTIKLKDVWFLLENSDGSKSVGCSINWEKSLWDAMQLLSDGAGVPELTACDDQTGTQRLVDLAAILRSMTRFKQED